MITETLPIFQTTVEYANLRGLIDIESITTKLKNLSYEGNPWGCNTKVSYFSSEPNNFLSPEGLFFELTEVIKSAVLNIYKIQGGGLHSTVQVSRAWGNISRPGSFQEYHTHGGEHYSAILYLKVPKDSGTTVFQSPFSFFDMLPLPKTDRNKSSNIDTIKVTGEEGDLLIFRSYIGHSVELNRSDSDRVTMAFNFLIQE